MFDITYHNNQCFNLTPPLIPYNLNIGPYLDESSLHPSPSSRPSCPTTPTFLPLPTRRLSPCPSRTRRWRATSRGTALLIPITIVLPSFSCPFLVSVFFAIIRLLVRIDRTCLVALSAF